MASAIIERGFMKTLILTLTAFFSLSVYCMTSEEAQKFSAQKLKEAMDHSEEMHLEKERIVQEANLKRKERERKAGPNYEDQKIYEQDNENNN